jgi:transposase InsO family protein
MPWKERTVMSQREEFVQLAVVAEIPFRELCRRFQISPPTGYKWLARSREDTPDFSDRSRRPRISPMRTADAVEEAVVALRTAHRTWGGRKIVACLTRDGHHDIPAPSTITGILRRHDLLDDAQCHKRKAFQRFEYDRPNAVWQMDFKGHFALRDGRCHPLTILDDHSRYNIALQVCTDERGSTVRAHLIECFGCYGLPEQMLMDNGSTWRDVHLLGITKLEAWLMRLSIRVIHGRPSHPQTQGKEERFHRTLKADVLRYNPPGDLAGCQRAFDAFRHVYNHVRPHEALDMKVPASRYAPSPRAYPGTLPPIEYDSQDEVRKVFSPGQIRFKSRIVIVGRGLVGENVAVRATLDDGLFEIVYCNSVVKQIDLRTTTERHNV